jgi:hypothetical protein
MDCRQPGVVPASAAGFGLRWLALFLAARAVAGELVVLRPSADTALLEAFPVNNFGGQAWFNAGTTQNYTKNRGLLKFDVAGAVPAGARILSATLQLEITGQPIDGYSTDNFLLHRVLRDWGEGSKSGQPPRLGAPAGAGECNWIYRFAQSTNTWAAPGGSNGVDFANAPSAGRYIYDVFESPYVWGPTPQMTADAQLWLDQPTTNFGWMLLPEHEEVDFTARRFGSREDANTNNAPLLTLEFTTCWIRQVQVEGGRVSLFFTVQAGQPYAVEYCDELVSGGWLELTNLPPSAVTTNLTVTDGAAGDSRFYRLRSP